MDEYPRDFVSIGTVENVYTTHVTHQEQFFIHLDTRSSILEEIMDKLETRYSQLGPNDKTLSQMKLGGLCAAKFTDDNNWYRVKITDLLKNGLIEVNFVDYGNTDYVSADRVKMLDPDLMQYPVQSYKCALAGVSCQHDLWPPELRVQFEDLVVDQQCKAVFTGKSEEDIYLLDMYDENGTYINKLFGATEKPSVPADPKVKSNGNHSVQGFNPLIWREGQKLQVVVVYVINPDSFWCQEADPTSKLLLLSEELSGLHMTQKMGPLQDMRPGAICAAKFHEDEAWYRGIIQSLSRNQAQVHFVDYGNTETVGIDSICELQPQFRVLPTLAVKCSLNSVRDTDGSKWSAEAIEEFEKLVVDKEFELSVTGKQNDGYNVSLLDVEENKDVGSQFKEIMSHSGIKARTPPKTGKVSNSNQTQPKKGLDLPVGTTSDVFLSWIDNPADFWVQLQRASDTLDKLSSELQEYYAQPRSTALSAPGAFVIARFSEDQQWYRGLVVKEFDELVKVLFIDYGNADTIPKSEVRQVNPQFGQIDPLAFRCSLKGIKPLPQDNSWSVDAKHFLEKLTENGCQCEVLSKNDAFRFVNLKVDGKDVTQELVSLAVVAGSQIASVKPNSPSYLPCVRLNENQTEQVLVTHIDNPHSFWIQLNKSSADLDAVMEKLDNHYSEEGGTPVARPAVGQACVAQYSLDNAWYRAVIINITSAGYEVHFVDYGNKEVVAPNLVCVAEPRFLDLPSQAIKCRLPLPGDLSSLTDAFSDLVLEKDVSLKVVAGGDVSTVDLIIDGQSVCGVLRNPSGGRSNGSADTRGHNATNVPGLKPAKPIPGGKTVKAFTSMVHSPGKFFLQMSGVDDELSTLMDQVSKQYVPQGVPVVSQLSVGMYCVALYQDDNQWYRGKITSAHGDQCEVLFVDYGNEEFVDNGSVKVLTPEVSSSPILAYQCSLHGVEAGEWSESSIEFFESLVMEQELNCTFVTQSEVSISCNGEDVASKMVSAGHCRRAAGPGPKSPLAVSTQSGFGGGRPPKSPGFGQSPRKQESSPGGFGGGKSEGRGFGGGRSNDNFDDSREEKRGFGGGGSKFGGDREGSKGFGGGRQEGRGFGGGGRKFGGGDDSGSHKSDDGSERGGFKSKPRNDGDAGFGGGRRERNATDSSGGAAAEKFTYADPPSEPESAILVHIDDDGTFYLQLPSMEKDILFLSRRMAGSYKTGGPRLKGTAEKGTICCCKFPDDGSMYRCQVEAIDGSKVLVRYMDFGNVAEHTTFDLKFMFPDLLQYPAQAFPCKLRGFDWSLDKADTFGVATLDKDLQVTFTSETPPFLVDIKTPDGDLLSMMTGKIAPPAPKVSSPAKKSPSQAGGGGGGFGAKSPRGFGANAGMDASTPKKFDSPVIRSLNLSTSPAKPAVPNQVFLPQTVPSDPQKAFISHISDNGNFFLQLEKDTELLESLTEKLSNLNSNLPHPGLSKGAACAAIFSEDSSWYRARITEVNNDEFSVTFVDFGNGDKVSKENIRPLSEELLSAAPLAYQCLFDGESEALCEKSKEKLEEFVLEHQLTVSFSSQTVPFAVAATTSDGQDLREIVCPSNRFGSLVIPKDVTPAGVCHIEDDGRFFICFYKRYKTKDKLLKSLQAHYSSAEVDHVESPEVEIPCGIKSSLDDRWHRGCIKSVNDAKIEVQYVDIGKLESFEAQDLKALPPNFLKEPPFALECRLKGVDSWTDELKGKFIGMTDTKILNATFFTTSPPCRVSLARSIELDLLGLNAPEPDSPRKTVDESVVSSANMNRSTVFEGGDSFITEFTPEGIFYVQLVSEEEQLQGLSDNLDALLTSEQIEPDTVEVGNFLCAKFTEDDVWYRATVEEEEGDKFTVRFVDYGNTDTLSKDRLASVPKELNTASIPSFAYKCTLSTLMCDVEKFKAITLDKQVSIEIVSTEDDVFNVNVVLDGKPLFADQETEVVESEEKNIGQSDVDAKPGSTERTTVIVPFVISPSRFYVQLQAQESQLDTMMNDLFEDLTGLEEGDGHIPEDLAVGDLCAALYEESWYRVKVVSFGAEDQSAQVLYVDHGNTETVSDRSELRALPDKYKSLPLFGHEAALPGIKPVDTEWTEEAIEAFKSLVEEKSLLADLLDTSDDKPWVVQLLDMGTPIQDSLIAKGHGMAVESIAVSSSNKRIFSEASDTTGLVEDPATDVEGTTEKIKIGCVSDKLEELKEVKVYASHVENPSQIWCQLSSSTGELELLADKIESVYSTILDSDKITGEISTGDLVVGLFEDDEMRYRSQVMEAQNSETEKVLLRFIDYGNCGSCARENILKIRGELCSQPAFSLCCSLDKVQSLEEEWSSEVCTRLTELTTDQELLLTLVGRKQDGTALVDLVLVETGKSLSAVLLEEGLAKILDVDTSLAVEKQQNVGKGDVSECLEITQPIMESTAMVDEASPNNFQDYSFGYTDDGYYRCVELNLHSSYDIIVCNDELPNAFCVQLRELEGEFETLSEEIQEYVNNNAYSEYRPKIGDPCLVKHEDVWQRALVRMDTNDRCYIVFAVDIGWELSVKPEQMRSMPSQFLELPGQAIHCYLAGIVSMEPEWSAEAIDFFTDYIKDHDLHINVLESAEDGKYGVSMTTMQDSSTEYAGSSLNQLMVELGHSDVVPGSNIEVQYDMERTLDTDMLEELEESFKEVEKDKVKGAEMDASTSQIDTYLTSQEQERLACEISLEVDSNFYHLVHMSKSEIEERSLAIDEKSSSAMILSKRDMAFDIASAVDRIDKLGCIDLFPEESLPYLNSDIDSELEVSRELDGATDKTPQKCSKGEKSPLYTWSQPASPENNMLVTNAKVDATGDSNNNEDKIPISATDGNDNAGDKESSDTSEQIMETHACLDGVESDEPKGKVNLNEEPSSEVEKQNCENKFCVDDDLGSGQSPDEECSELAKSFEALPLDEEEKQLLPYEYYEKLEKKADAVVISDLGGSSNDNLKDNNSFQKDEGTCPDNADILIPNAEEDGLMNGKVNKSDVKEVGDQDLSHCEVLEASKYDEDASYLTLDRTGFNDCDDDKKYNDDCHGAVDGIHSSGTNAQECIQNLREDDGKTMSLQTERSEISATTKVQDFGDVHNDEENEFSVSFEIAKGIVGDDMKAINCDENAICEDKTGSIQNKNNADDVLCIPDTTNVNGNHNEQVISEDKRSHKRNCPKDGGTTGVHTAASSGSASLEGSFFESCLEPDVNGSGYEGEINDCSCHDITTDTAVSEELSVQEGRSEDAVTSIVETLPLSVYREGEEDGEEGPVGSVSTLDDTYDNFESASETFDDTDSYLVIDESAEIDSSVDRSGIDCSDYGPDTSSCYDTSSLVFSDSQIDSSCADTSTSTQLTDVSDYSVSSTSFSYNDVSTCTDSDPTAEEDSLSSESLESTSSVVKPSLTADLVEQGAFEALQTSSKNEIEKIKSITGKEVEEIYMECGNEKLDCVLDVGHENRNDNRHWENKDEEMTEETANEISPQLGPDKIVKDVTCETKSNTASDHSEPISFQSADDEEEVISGNLEENAPAIDEYESSPKIENEEKNAIDDDKESESCADKESEPCADKEGESSADKEGESSADNESESCADKESESCADKEVVATEEGALSEGEEQQLDKSSNDGSEEDRDERDDDIATVSVGDGDKEVKLVSSNEKSEVEVSGCEEESEA